MPVKVSLLGTEKLESGFHFEGPEKKEKKGEEEEEGEEVPLILFPSDHYGLRAELRFIPDGWANPNSELLMRRNVGDDDKDEKDCEREKERGKGRGKEREKRLER